MRLFLDTEFNGDGGELISLAMVTEYCTLDNYRGESLHLVNSDFKDPNPWVEANVMPILLDGMAAPFFTDLHSFHMYICDFLDMQTPKPLTIIADWPTDFVYLCQNLVTSEGAKSRAHGLLTMRLMRVNSYPNKIPGCVQHNAWWDAFALKERLTLED